MPDNTTELTQEQKFKQVLDEDLIPLEDIHACMVARKNLEGIVSMTDKFREEVTPVWETLKGTMDELFEVIAKYSEYGLDKVYFEMGNYDVMFFVLPTLDNALVAIVPALANRGLLEVELENARRRVIKIIDEHG